MRCTSSGGRALSMSVTGPDDFNSDLDNIQAVGTARRMGSDSFSDTTDVLSGGSDRDSYQCTASNGVSTDPTDSVELRGDLCSHFVQYNFVWSHVRCQFLC